MKFSELLVAIDSLDDIFLQESPIASRWKESGGPEFVTEYSGSRCAYGSWYGRTVLDRYSLEEIDAMYARWRIEQEE